LGTKSLLPSLYKRESRVSRDLAKRGEWRFSGEYVFSIMDSLLFEMIAPLIAEHLIVPQVVHTVAVGTERWALTLGETGCPCAPKGEKCEG
jgi:hypothetical protein